MAPYFEELERLASFKDKKFNVPIGALAKAGFYYTGPQDLVTCAYCLTIVGKWSSTEKPLLVHKYFNPDCEHVKHQLLGLPTPTFCLDEVDIS